MLTKDGDSPVKVRLNLFYKGTREILLEYRDHPLSLNTFSDR